MPARARQWADYADIWNSGDISSILSTGSIRIKADPQPVKKRKIKLFVSSLCISYPCGQYSLQSTTSFSNSPVSCRKVLRGSSEKLPVCLSISPWKKVSLDRCASIWLRCHRYFRAFYFAASSAPTRSLRYRVT